jgi:acetyltransferase-like isoleucine patch superfamily enzyme
MRTLVKAAARGVFLALALPCALLTGFGRFKGMYTFFAQMFALGPGLIGDYARAGYYALTLRRCSQDVRISFGTYFVHPDAVVDSFVSIGAYCVLGRVYIGRHTQMSSHVQVLSGPRQHVRDIDGRLQDGTYSQIEIGPECWIGAGAVIAADVGKGATVAAGAVVLFPVAPGASVSGNPARAMPILAKTASKSMEQ